MIKLAVFDMDGTLFNEEKMIPNNTKEALKKLKQNGLKLAVATGRAYYLIDKELIKENQIDYVICCNGSGVYDNQGKVIYKHQFSKEIMHSMIKDMKEDHIPVLFEYDETACVYSEYEACCEKIMQFFINTSFLRDETKQPQYHLDHNPLQGACYMKEQDALKYRSKYPDYDFVAYANDGYDILSKGINKATGIKYATAILGISLEEIIAFGDHQNDLEMIKQCKIGVAMGNATDGLKKIADFITKSNIDDGITYACKHFKLI